MKKAPAGKRSRREYHSSRAPVAFASREEAINELAKLHHALCSESFVLGLAKCFNVPLGLASYKVDSREFKGLNQAWDDDGKLIPDGTYVFGREASSLASALCDALGVKYMGRLGRGSQLQSCVSALRQHITQEQAAL